MLNLKLARIKLGLSQSELAKKIGVKEYSISRYETGIQSPSVDTLLKLAEALDVTTDYLLGRDESNG